MSDVLDYFRAKHERFKDVPDETLIRYIGEEHPEFKKNQGFRDEFDAVTMTAEREAMAQSEAGVEPDTRLNPPTLQASDVSTWNRFRTSDWGRRLFGPMEIEKEGGAKSTGSPVEIASAMLEFTSPPPPVREVVTAVMESPVGKVLQPARLIGPKAEAVMQGATELVTSLPLAPLGGGAVGKTALGLFGAEYVHSLLEAREAYKQALENGDAPEAIKIATQTMLGGTLLGAGAFHAATAKVTPEVVAPRTTEAVKQAAEALPVITEPVAETRPERLVGKGAVITPPPEKGAPKDIAGIEQLLRDITIQEAQTVAEPAKRATREAPPIIGERQVTVEQQLILPDRFLANEGKADRIRQRIEAMRPEYEAARVAEDGPRLSKLAAEWMDLNRQLRDVEVDRLRLQQGELEGTYPPTAEQLGTFQSRGTVREISDVTKTPAPERLPVVNQPESTRLANKPEALPRTEYPQTVGVVPPETLKAEQPLPSGEFPPARPPKSGGVPESEQRSGVIQGTDLERWADRVIAEDPRSKTRMTFDPLDVRRLTAVAVKGAAYMERGIRNFADWSKAMIGEFGEGIRPHLQDLFSRSANYYERKYSQRKAGDQSAIQQTAGAVLSDVQTLPGKGTEAVPAAKGAGEAATARGEVQAAPGGGAEEIRPPEFRRRVYDAIYDDLKRSTDTLDLERTGWQIESARNGGALTEAEAAALNVIFKVRESATGDVLGPLLEKPDFNTLKGSETIETKTKEGRQEVLTEAKAFQDRVDSFTKATNEELSTYKGDVAGGATGFAWDIGASAKTAGDVAVLRKLAEDSAAKVKEAVASGDMTAAMAEAGRQPAEAYEFATGVKLDGTPKWEMFEKRVPGYKPPVPDQKWVEAHPTAAAATPAEQRIGIIPEGIELTMDTIGSQSWWNRYFTSNRGLPEGVPAAWLKRMGEVRAETRGASYAARDLANAMREVHGISFTRLATRGLSDVPKPVMDSIQRVLTGQADINTLPERLRTPVQKIREHVDALSTKIMETLGEDNPMSATIGENMGIYLTRSYRIFDDPKWIKKIPVDVRNNAEAYLAERLSEKAGVPVDEAMRDAARTELREMLADWSDNGLDKLMQQGKLGAKDVSLFMQRKDIAPEIRAVMGEYGDPVTNYIRSVTKMSRWLGDQAFLHKVREIGLGQWLFEEGAAPAGFEHKLAADASSSMYPLNGLRTSEAIKDVFETFNKHTVSDSLIARAYFLLNAWSRQAKTVWSALTQARNFIGNPFFNIKSGHFNFTDYGPALKAQFADIAGSNKVAQDFYKELARYGLVDENPIVSDLRASIRDAGLQDPSFEDYSMRGAAKAIRLAVTAPQRAYRLPDEMGKTVGWLAETRDLQSAHPEWTLEQAKQEAATRVRNEYPTYSMIPEAVQQFRKQPFVGPFVNFAYETVRNGYWTLRNGSVDLFSGENAAQRKHGAKKLGGFMAVLASGTALDNLSKYVFSVDKKTDDDTRRFLPDHSKNAELIFLDKDGTKVRFVNYSYLNPYSQMTDPFVAAMNNDERGIFNKSMAAFGEFVRPFANEQMLAGAISDVVENKDSNGRPIYNEQDDPNTKFAKSAGRILRSLEPGSIERFRRRILPAIKGDPTASGDERSVGLEVFSELTGLRTDQIDLMKSFSFKLKEYDEQLDNARRLATSVLFSPKPHTTEEAVDAYKQADDARFNLWRDMHNDTAALVRQGGTVKDVRNILKASGMSVRDANKVIQGSYDPLSISVEDYRKLGKVPPSEVIMAIAAERGGRLSKKLSE